MTFTGHFLIINIMNIIDLTKQLISIPSYVDEKTNEIELGNFITNYLKQNTDFVIKKQKAGNRFNIFACKNEVKLLLIGHIDTVPPKNKQQLKPAIVGDKLYGLGAADMKGGLACILSALSQVKKISGIGCLFYVGEEYDFIGMENALKTLSIKPDLIFSADGTDMKIGTSCREILEIDFKAYGKSAPTYREQLGINPILILSEVINSAKAKFLGSSINLSYLNAGLLVNNKLVNQPNCVPNFAKGTLDIRPYKTDPYVIVDFISKELKRRGVKFDYKTSFEYLGWNTQKRSIKSLVEVISKFEKASYQNPKNRGFIDIAMMANKFKVPCVDFGPGLTKNAHAENEYVDIKNLYLCERIFKKIIELFAK